ncbi:MAG TPA: ABC transporter ATP-binding protein [Nannocystaceae bacterium]|nr:ABC transporter ATP-binding protein [Nannocystaceae bacterium]
MEPQIDLSGVEFGYGKNAVLRDFSLQLPRGEIALLAAPNGRGKTTALWLAAGLLRPRAGRVRVFGRDPFHDRDVLGRVGFLAEGSPLPESWQVSQVLTFQRDTFPRWDQDECDRLVRLFRLDLRARVRELSRGQRGKLGLVTVLATRPEVLLLDEPLLGLDVATRRVLTAEILGRVAEQGCSILLTGHEIAEAEAIADRFVLLDDGKIACDESIAELLARHRILAWDTPVPPPPEALQPAFLPWALGKRALACDWDDDVAKLWLSQGGRAEPADLETVYLSLTGELDHA